MEKSHFLKKFLVCALLFTAIPAAWCVQAASARKIKQNYNVKVGQVFEVVFDVNWEKGEYFKLLSSKNDPILRMESQEFYKPGWGGYNKPCQVVVVKALKKGMTRARFSCHNQKYYDRKVQNSPKYRITVNVQ